LFTGSHLLNVQKPASKWCIVERFIRTIVERSCSVPQEQGREFALITQSGSETKQQLGFPNTQCRTTVWLLYEQILPIYIYILKFCWYDTSGTLSYQPIKFLQADALVELNITHQAIELESCSNPKRCGKSFSLHLKKLESFGFHFFVSDIVSWVGFRPFWLRSPGPKAKKQNLGKIFLYPNSGFFFQISFFWS